MKKINSTSTISIFFRRLAKKSLLVLRIKLQKLTFCRNVLTHVKPILLISMLLLFYSCVPLAIEEINKNSREEAARCQKLKNNHTLTCIVVQFNPFFCAAFMPDCYESILSDSSSSSSSSQ